MNKNTILTMAWAAVAITGLSNPFSAFYMTLVVAIITFKMAE